MFFTTIKEQTIDLSLVQKINFWPGRVNNRVVLYLSDGSNVKFDSSSLINASKNSKEQEAFVTHLREIMSTF